MQLESGEYFLKSHQKEAKEAQRRKEKVCWVDHAVVLLTADRTLPNAARRGHRHTAGRASGSVCTSEGRCGSYGGREEEAEAEGEGGGRGRWRETSQEQKEEKGHRGGPLVLLTTFVLPLPMLTLGSHPIVSPGDFRRQEEEFSKPLALDPNTTKQTNLGPAFHLFPEPGATPDNPQDLERPQWNCGLDPVPYYEH